MTKDKRGHASCAEPGHATEEGSTICVAAPSRGVYSETFIRAHINLLPAETHVLYGGSLPTCADANVPLLREYNLIQRVLFRLKRQRRGLAWDQHAKHVAAVARFLAHHQVQAVLAEYGPTGVAMREVCAEAAIPLIVHFHGYDAYKLDTLVEYGRQYSDLFEIAAAVVVVSRDMYQQVLGLGAPQEKLYLNPYGVDVSRFGGADPRGSSPLFVTVGRFVDKKGPLLSLLSFEQVLKRVPEARMVMIGDGPLLNACKDLARALNFNHAVEFRGVQSHDVVAATLRDARAFVQHSLRSRDGDSEGIPLAVLEACATGLPVISTRHAGIPDVVVEEETGFLVNERDVNGMAQAMARLAMDPDLAARLGRAGRRRIEERFSMEQSIGNLWTIIESVIQRSEHTDATC